MVDRLEVLAEYGPLLWSYFRFLRNRDGILIIGSADFLFYTLGERPGLLLYCFGFWRWKLDRRRLVGGTIALWVVLKPWAIIRKCSMLFFRPPRSLRQCR